MNGGVAQRVRIVGACVVLAACSDLSDDFVDDDTSMSGASGDAGESGTGGATSGTGTGGNTSGTGTGGHEDGPGGSEATGGSTTGEAGRDSGELGGTGGTGGTMSPTCATDCQAEGQICDVDTLTCICPAETPDQCPNDDVRCTNVMGNDDDHCGDCATKCPTTSACNDGVCSAAPEAIYTGGSYLTSLALSGDTLYWADSGKAFGMAVTGGPVTPVTASGGLGYVYYLGVDGTNLYTYDRNIDFTPPSLFRIPLAGGSPERIVQEGGIAQSARPIHDFAAQAGVLYYTVGNQVKSVPADATNGTGTVVASATDSGKLGAVAVDGSQLFWTAAAPQPSASYIVEGDLISGGNRRTLGTTHSAARDSLTTDGTRVYWADGANLYRRVYDASTAAETVASTDGPKITVFAVNATTAYYATSDARVEKATFGGKPRAIARNQMVGSLVVGESGVYWTSQYGIVRADL